MGNYTCVVTNTVTNHKVLGPPTPLTLRNDGECRAPGLVLGGVARGVWRAVALARTPRRSELHGSEARCPVHSAWVRKTPGARADGSSPPDGGRFGGI